LLEKRVGRVKRNIGQFKKQLKTTQNMFSRYWDWQLLMVRKKVSAVGD
jgi:hypothetical protein